MDYLTACTCKSGGGVTHKPAIVCRALTNWWKVAGIWVAQGREQEQREECFEVFFGIIYKKAKRSAEGQDGSVEDP